MRASVNKLEARAASSEAPRAARRRSSAALLAGLAAALAAPSAPAAPGDPVFTRTATRAEAPPVGLSATTATTATVAPALLGGRRPVPRYDGREPEGTTPAEVMLWVPRVLFFPAYLLTEYGLRRPLGWLVSTAERNEWPALILDLFTFGPDRKAGVVPTALIDFGFRPSFGAYFFWDDLGFAGNDLRVHLATGGSSWYLARLTDRVTFAGGRELAFSFSLLRRPDYIFEGIGAVADDDRRARFGTTQVDGLVSYRLPLLASGHAEVFAGVRRLSFLEESSGRDPSVPERVAEGAYPLPPGFGEPYALYRHGVRLALDTRRPRPEAGSGARLELRGEHAFDLARPAERSFVRYGAALGGFLDLTGQNRNLGLSIAADFADPITGGEIPFTELVFLTNTPGGIDRLTGRMRGFLPGELLGQSAISALLEYRWPVWVFLDGHAHFAVGNAFGRHLEGFEWRRLRASFGLGLSSVGRRDNAFELEIAFGTEPFERGFAVDSVRVVIGTSRGL